MNRIPLLIAALLLPLAGCLGIPEGSIAPGDSVTATVTIQDLHTGEVLLLDERVDFIAGSGSSGLGFEFERRVQGSPVGYQGTMRISNDPSLQWGAPVSVDGVFEDSLLGTIDSAQFTQYFGEPVEGAEFNPEFSFYTFRVESVVDGLVTYRVVPVDGQVDPVAHLGATLVTTVDMDRDVMIQTLVADVGATFQIAPPSPFSPNTPLGLEPGSYRAAGNEGDQIVYDYSASGNPNVIGRDLLIQVTINAVIPGEGQAIEPVDGNFGVRSSPVINGQPSDDVDYGAHSDSAAHEPADDHMDDGHTH